MIRCSNCGWNNPNGNAKCEKCNQTLNTDDEDLYWKSRLEDESQEDKSVFMTCEKCGYQLANDVTVCPECGFYINSKETVAIKRRRNLRETVKDVKSTELDDWGVGKRNQRATVVDNTSRQKDGTEDTFLYKLLAIDRPLIDTKSNGVSPMCVIEMKSSAKLDLKMDEVVLIGGLRFTRIE